MRAIHYSLFTIHFVCILPLLALASPAHADVKFQQLHAFPKTQIKEKPVGSTKEPVVLTASRIDYDHENNIVTATGNVEIAQGDSVLLADVATYDVDNDMVTASGDVSMLEPSGNVYFADELELKDDLKSGVIDQMKGRLSDNSIIVAAKANKIDENHTELFKMAYTPCKCETENGEPKDPMWSIKAGYAMIDQQDQEIRYNDASFDAFGLPIAYTPYFSNPTPGSPNESGLLMPTLMQSSNIGTVYKQPIYYAIAPDRDLTLTPIYTSLNGPVLAGEYREKFDAGPLEILGSFAEAPATDALGNPIVGHELRGNVDARGAFKLSDQYDWGFNIRRASDDTYLHLYNFSEDTLLISKVYAEGFNFIGDNDRTYATVQGLSFQGLTGQDNPNVIPVIMPLTDVTWQSDPGIYHSRVALDGDLMALYRKSGPESRRLSGTAGWNLPYITEDGEVIQFNVTMRSDVYNVSDVQLVSGSTFVGTVMREVPQASMLWRYPFIDRWGTSSLLLEPIVEADVTAGGGNPGKIPNEDSLVPEFNDTNIFSPNRFAGLDRVETGAGMSYGLRGQAQLFSDKYIDWLLGQHYRFYNDANFPFSGDLNSHFSDYVGKVGLTYLPFTIAYRFRFDKDTLSATRSEVDGGFNEYPLAVNVSYLSLHDDPVLADSEVISGSTALNLDKEWSWNFAGARDLRLGQTDVLSTGFAFKNECTTFTTMVGKDYTFLQDIKPALTFWFTISLKNLE